MFLKALSTPTLVEISRLCGLSEAGVINRQGGEEHRGVRAGTLYAAMRLRDGWPEGKLVVLCKVPPAAQAVITPGAPSTRAWA